MGRDSAKYDGSTAAGKVSAVGQHGKYKLQYRGNLRGVGKRPSSDSGQIQGLKKRKFDTQEEALAASPLFVAALAETTGLRVVGGASTFSKHIY
jgi:hypothetical protein